MLEHADTQATAWARTWAILRPGQSPAFVRSSVTARYGVAVLASLTPVLLKVALDPFGIGREAPFLLLIISVLVSSWYGGLGPGLLATGLTALSCEVFFLPPYGVVTNTADTAAAVTVYCVEGCLVSCLNVAFHRSQQERTRLASEERIARSQLEAASQISTWIETSPIPMVSMDLDGVVVGWNAAATRLFGWSADEATGKRAPMVPVGLREEERRTLAHVQQGVPVSEIDLTLEKKDGSPCDVRLSMAPVKNAVGQTTGVMAILVDVTERKRMEEQLHHQASHDALTDLPNRTLLHDRVRQAILNANRNRSTLALLLLDLDGFKDVNDSFGHQCGDLLLQDVADRLEQTLRQSDMVARLGGDEFAALLVETDADGAEAAAAKILSSLSDPFQVAGQDLVIGASIGAALYPQHGQDANGLLQHADVAMYRAKESGCGYSVYAAGQVLARSHLRVRQLERCS